MWQKMMLGMVFLLSLAGCAGGTKAPEPVRVTDLLRTYVQGDVPRGVVMILPAGYSSGLETIAQARFAQALTASGYQVRREDAAQAESKPTDMEPIEMEPVEMEPVRIVFTMDAPAGVLEGPWKSPVQFEEPLNPQLRLPTGPLLNTSDFSGPPVIAFRPGTKGPAITPSLKMRITIKQGSRELWTGVAHSALDGRSRQGLVYAMADALAGALNQTIDERDFRFTPANSAVQEIASP